MIIVLFTFSCTEDFNENDKLLTQKQEIEKRTDELQNLNTSTLVNDGFDESQIKDGSEFAFRFPSINKRACVETVRPEFCEWGRAADDIVLLEVTRVSFVSSPIIDSATGDLLPTCSAALFPALKIEGIIGESVDGQTGTISLKVGYSQYNSWNVRPYLNGRRNLTWSFDGFKISNGSQIGLALRKNPTTGIYSLLGEPFFQLNSENRIEFSDIPGKCEMLEPKNVDGKTFDELREKLRTCSESEGINDRVRKKANLWNDRKFSDLGLCLSR